MSPRARVGVLISGRGSNMAALVYAAKAADCPFEIVLVAANDPDAAGLALARAEGIPTFAASHKGMTRAEFDAIIDAKLNEAGADYVALAGYMRLLSAEFVRKWAGRMLNIHPSLLPRYKGLDTHQRALDAGDRVAGCSVHLVTEELDAGEVLARTEVAVIPGDTAETLAARVLIAEHQLYAPTLAAFVARRGSPDHLLAEVRRRALALPEAEEKLSHGAPGFFVRGGKFFAYFSEGGYGEGPSLFVKASGVDEQAALIEQDPELYYRPPYLGPSGWIGIRLGADTQWDHIERWLTESWRASAPKRLAALPI